MPATAPQKLARQDPRGEADADSATPQRTEDERDIEIARRRLREIEANPGSVLRGAELDEFIKSIL